jgi:hypothetical protein
MEVFTSNQTYVTFEIRVLTMPTVLQQGRKYATSGMSKANFTNFRRSNHNTHMFYRDLNIGC